MQLIPLTDLFHVWFQDLAYFLSMKFAPQRTQEMKLLYEDEFARALSEDGSPASTLHYS
jgi:hypothetical protein